MVELMHNLKSADLNDLCDAAEAAIIDGGGFGWLAPPPRDVLESYWSGVLLIPERDLLVGRLDGVIAGSCQVLRPARNNEVDGQAADDEETLRQFAEAFTGADFLEGTTAFVATA